MKLVDLFFGAASRLRAVSNGAGYCLAPEHSKWQPFLDTCFEERPAKILPRIAPNDAVKWYVLCATERTARVVRDELTAFVGRSYSTFDGRPAALDENDVLEKELMADYPGRVYVLETPEDGLRDALREKLRLLLRLWEDRPTRLAFVARPTGRILRDFEYTIANRDGESASDCIAELRVSGRLGALNALFLEVRRLGALGLWKDILSMPEVGSILATQRPRRVTEALIHAVYETELRSFEVDGRPTEAIAHCAGEVLPRYRELFKSHAGLKGYVVDASFLLAAVASTPPNVERVKEIVASYSVGGEEASYLYAIAAQLEATDARSTLGTLVDAKGALADADFDHAFTLARNLPESFEKVAILLQCAREMGALESAELAIKAVDALPERDWERFSSNGGLVRIYERLTSLVPTGDSGVSGSDAALEPIPSSWGEWLGRLTHPKSWPGAVVVAETGSREWSLEQLLSNPDEVERLASDVLATRPRWGEEALHDALPYLLRFVLAKEPDARLRPIYDSLFLVAAADEQVSIPQLAALCDLAEVRIALGVRVADYRDSVSALGAAVERTGSAQVAGPALELLDALASLPCPDEATRQSIAVRVHGVFTRWHRRIAPEQWVLFGEIAGELGLRIEIPEPQPDTTGGTSDDAWGVFAGKRVALYSLREPALRRAQAVLRKLCPSVSVQVFSDHVGGSPSLRAASATADVFVVAIAAAKHAATGFIEASRPATRVTLRARSQGSASLLEALASYANRTSPQ